ncbi:DNA cytosine methyltransferase [Leifsonia shinshuensis]
MSAAYAPAPALIEPQPAYSNALTAAILLGVAIARKPTGITFTDFFCGAGGSSVGLTQAGLELKLAANHWQTAIDTHASNFRDADHLVADISNYDMRRIPRTDVLWASPECTWHSPAGGRRREPDLDLFDEYVPNEAGIRSRATMFDVIRATEARRFKIVIVENVVEVTRWELFDHWLSMMERLGYAYQVVSASSAHIWGEGNPPAPQWRDRVYIVFSAKGVPMPDLTPRPWAMCTECDELVAARQSWKRADRRVVVGKYRTQYVYVCPSDRHKTTVVEPLVSPAINAIDASDLGTRIGDRATTGLRPLAASTLRRIWIGGQMFARPAVVAAHGQTWDSADPKHPKHGSANGYVRAWPADTLPLNARTGTPGDALAVPPFITAVNHSDGDQRAYNPLTQPMPTRSTKIGDGLTTPPYLVEMWGTSTARPTTEPLTTVTAGGNHHGLALPPGTFIQKHHGGLDYARIEHMLKPVTDPLPTTVTKPNTSLVVPTRTANRSAAAASAAAFTVDELLRQVEDYRFRMLGWSEHAAAQRFPSDYLWAGNKSQRTAQAGNAVSSNVARWIGEACVVALAGRLSDFEWELAA